MVTTLVDVLMDVLDCVDGAAHLNIDVGLVSPDEIGAVGNHPLIADLNSLVLLCEMESGELGPRETASILWIAISWNGCLLHEWLWESLAALELAISTL